MGSECSCFAETTRVPSAAVAHASHCAIEEEDQNQSELNLKLS